MILLTTSRKPTNRIRTFCRDLADSIPQISRFTRGKLSLDSIAERANHLKADGIIIVERWKGGSGIIRFFSLGQTGLSLVPPLIYCSGIRLRREFNSETKPVRSLAVKVLGTSFEVAKISEFFSNFLDIPVPPTNEATLKSKTIMEISSSTSAKISVTFSLIPEAIEVGPRITISRIAWNIQK